MECQCAECTEILGEMRIALTALVQQVQELRAIVHAEQADNLELERDHGQVCGILAQMEGTATGVIDSLGQAWERIDSLTERVKNLEESVRDLRTDWLPGVDRRLARIESMLTGVQVLGPDGCWRCADSVNYTVTQPDGATPVSVTYTDESGNVLAAPVYRGMGRVFGGDE